MTSVVRAGHLAPFFKSTSQVVANGLKPVAAVHAPIEKSVVQPLPKTSTVHSLHGSLPIRGLKARAGVGGELFIEFYCDATVQKVMFLGGKSCYITPCHFQCQVRCVSRTRISATLTSLHTVARTPKTPNRSMMSLWTNASPSLISSLEVSLI